MCPHALSGLRGDEVSLLSDRQRRGGVGVQTARKRADEVIRMRWKKAGGQHTMTLRCLLHSGVWKTVYEKWLVSKPTFDDLINFIAA
jgi:hypothetical protein